MPELPEVETLRQALLPLVKNKATNSAFNSAWQRWMKRLKDRNIPRFSERSILKNGSPMIIKELWKFMRARKKFWLLPIMVILFLLGGLLVLVEGSAVAPFIYTLF